MLRYPCIIFLVLFCSQLANGQGTGVLDLTKLHNYANQDIPDYITLDETPADNPTTDEGATLGRVLFYDKRLSINDTISCASCHRQSDAFGDPDVASTGVNGTTGRHSMRLINLRFRDPTNTTTFWDRRASSIEDQATQPIRDHVEMGFSGQDGNPDFDDLVEKLSAIPEYSALFSMAFGDSAITEDRIQKAIAQFVRSIQSFDSRYDIGRTQVNDEQTDFPNFTDDENAGKSLFFTRANNGGANCRACHSIDGFDNSAGNNPGNNGIITAIGGGTDATNTRSPNLRDIVDASGSPHGGFMHDASLTTLRQVVEHYNDIEPVDGLDRRLGGGNNPVGQELGLSSEQIDQIVAFMNTLTGSAVYTEEKWSDPFDSEGNLTLYEGEFYVDSLEFNTNEDTINLSWASGPGRIYSVWHSVDLENWSLVDGYVDATNTDVLTQYGPFSNPDSDRGFFRITEGISSSKENPNILFMILDDWAIDACAIYNSTPPATALANMPNLESLAENGLVFTRAYVAPTCSPTRAALMTGRFAHQTGIYVPSDSGNFSESEISLPEAFTAAGSPYALALIGKWHLGGGATGYADRGGWPEFYGIDGGGVGNYESWEKNSNGTYATVSTYTTTDQIDEALSFIERSENAAKPWFCWLAFNAAHTPFHDPPEALAPEGGFSLQAQGESTSAWQYRKALEALDTELGRLLEDIDLSTTNIIIVGDNGTPGQVVQLPFGDGHAKGSIYNGGTNVPMIVHGPAVSPEAGKTTSRLVKVVDFYPTLLELAGIDPATVATAEVLGQTTSFLPILSGTDIEDRIMVTEGGEGNNRGRAIMVDDYPAYKLIIFGDPEDVNVSATFEFYNINDDQNEMSPLDIPSLSGDALDAYNACLAVDASIGGGFFN